MRNMDVAHQFFYDRRGSFNRISMTVNYRNDIYYSYGTAIGQIVETITGKTACIISDNNFSHTTAKHISELRAACPYYDIFYLPQEMYEKEFHPFRVIGNCIRNLEYYSKSKLTQKANRENLSRYYKMLQNTLEIKIFESEFERTQKALDDFRGIYKSVNDPEKLKQLKQKQAEKDKQEREQAKKELENLLSNYSYLTLIKAAYTDYSGQDILGFKHEMQKKIKKAFDPKNEFSFIWFEGDFVKTSKHITVNKKEAIILLKLWANGKLKHGMTIAHYTVLEVQKTYVKVGCHKIPVENLKALMAEISEPKAIEEAA